MTADDCPAVSYIPGHSYNTTTEHVPTTLEAHR